MKRKLTAPDQIERAVTDRMYNLYDFNIKSPTDIRRIIHIYREELIDMLDTEPIIDNVLHVMNMEFLPGFTHIYGPPDCGKSLLGRTMVNILNAQGLRTCFIDSDNKVVRGELDTGVMYLEGRAATYQAVKKLLSTGTIDVMIIDTICSLSRSEDFIRSSIKYTRLLGSYCIMLNQTRFHRFGQGPAGYDNYVALSRHNHRIVSSKRLGKRWYIVLNTGMRFVYDLTDIEGPYPYLENESLLALMLSQGQIIKMERIYKYEGQSYSKEEILKTLNERPGQYTPGISEAQIQDLRD